MNPQLTYLQPYPFEKLAGLLGDTTPRTRREPIRLSIGEPKHDSPAFVRQAVQDNLDKLAHYPTTRGDDALREAVSEWLTHRFDLPHGLIDARRHVLPLNGTREGLFSLAQAIIDPSRNPIVIMPNPFYQIYEGAAVLAGAEPYYVNMTKQSGFSPDFDTVPEDIWERCQLVYVCSPNNPTGTTLTEGQLQRLIALADRYDFILAADECYSEIYLDETQPPPGLLGAAARMGRSDLRRCLVFHSLSKRSNLPGMRSGFIAGDAELVDAFFRYRTYHGCAMPPHHQAASTAAWSDEAHVRENRSLYREKFDAVLEILSPVVEAKAPQGGFYLWPQTPIDDTEFTQRLFQEEALIVLPGTYLSRQAQGTNPGRFRVRIALVPPLTVCVEAARRLRRFIEQL